MKITKDTGISLGVLAIIIPFLFFFWNSKADKEEVKEVKTEAKELVEDVDENENVNISQTVLIEQISKTVDLLNQKIDKELAR